METSLNADGLCGPSVLISIFVPLVNDCPRGLRGTRVLVTGGSRGIGEAIAREVAAKGAKLVLVARDAALLETVVADLSNPSEVAGLFTRWRWRRAAN